MVVSTDDSTSESDLKLAIMTIQNDFTTESSVTPRLCPCDGSLRFEEVAGRRFSSKMFLNDSRNRVTNFVALWLFGLRE